MSDTLIKLRDELLEQFPLANDPSPVRPPETIMNDVNFSGELFQVANRTKVNAVQFPSMTGYATGTVHLVDMIGRTGQANYQLWAGALHVFERQDIGPLRQQYGPCYRVDTGDMEPRDLYFFTFAPEDIVQAWVSSLDHPQDIVNDLKDSIIRNKPHRFMMMGYPFGTGFTVPKIPQIRYSQFEAQIDISDIGGPIWATNDSNPSVDGMSGGFISDEASETSIDMDMDSKGVLLSTSYFTNNNPNRPHWSCLQLFHKKLVLIPDTGEQSPTISV